MKYESKITLCSRKFHWLHLIPCVRVTLVVQLQQSLVHLWVQGNQVLLAVPEIQAYLPDLVDPSVLMVL